MYIVVSIAMIGSKRAHIWESVVGIAIYSFFPQHMCMQKSMTVFVNIVLLMGAVHDQGCGQFNVLPSSSISL